MFKNKDQPSILIFYHFMTIAMWPVASKSAFVYCEYHSANLAEGWVHMRIMKTNMIRNTNFLMKIVHLGERAYSVSNINVKKKDILMVNYIIKDYICLNIFTKLLHAYWLEKRKKDIQVKLGGNVYGRQVSKMDNNSGWFAEILAVHLIPFTLTPLAAITAFGFQ